MSQALGEAEPLRLGPEAMGWTRRIAAPALVVAGPLAAIAINALVGKAVFPSLVCLLAIAGATAVGGLGYGLSAALVASVTILLIQPGDLTNAERAVLVVLFPATALVISVLIGRERSARTAADEAAARAEVSRARAQRLRAARGGSGRGVRAAGGPRRHAHARAWPPRMRLRACSRASPTTASTSR